MSSLLPEQEARLQVDQQLEAAGWAVQDVKNINLLAQLGVAVREFPTATGPADYMLFADGKAIGIVEAKKVGETLSAVHAQAARYGSSDAKHIQRWTEPLSFTYETTGVETLFTDERDPTPRARRVFCFHRPEELIARVKEPDTLRARLTTFPELVTAPLRECQIDAISSLEKSLSENRPRSLIQMATGSGKTYMAVTTAYRLIKHAGAKRILFLVDRGNLGRQTVNEFQQFTTPDDGRKFTELYNVQMLGPAGIDPVAKVTVSTIQRLYSQLAGKDLEEDIDERSGYEVSAAQPAGNQDPVPISYNPRIPIEEFDFVIVDECHRSIYNLWKQVIEYFDAFLIGLTATPSKHTLGFFNQNLVTEYPHTQAVADGVKVNVGYDIYRIRTQITESGSALESGFEYKKRDRLTRTERWKLQDEEETYSNRDLDRSVTSHSQIRTVIQTFRDKLFTDLFPSRPARAASLGFAEPWVPKTLIFAKDDNHAEEIVNIVREEFAKGNDFCQKITYRAGAKPEDLIKAFRTAPEFRIAVTVDMIATGTDIKPLECLLFMRDVRSQLYFEQMKGRGTRTIDPTDFQSVTPDGGNKTHFVLVDAVGVTESDKTDSRPLERKPTIAFDKLLLSIAMGARDPDTLSSAANRLARLDRNLTESDRDQIRELTGGLSVKQIASQLLHATDAIAAHATGKPDASPAEITAEALQTATEQLANEAAKPIASNPALRELLDRKRRDTEMTLDHASVDTVLSAAYDTEKAEQLIQSWTQFIEANKDELTALQIIYNRPHKDRHLTYDHIKQLAAAVSKPPYNIAPEEVWRAYENLEGRKPTDNPVRTLTNLITLVRHSIQPDTVPLVPYTQIVNQRFTDWLQQQQTSDSHSPFSEDHLDWLHMIKDHIATSAAIEPNDFEDVPFNQKGGLAKARKLFGKELKEIIDNLNEVLVG